MLIAFQHMAVNTLSLLKYLASLDSPLPSLTTGYTKPSTMFFSLLNSFFVQYSFRVANALHFTLFVSSVILVAITSNVRHKISIIHKSRHIHLHNGGTEVDYDVDETIEKLEDDSSLIWIDHVKAIVVLTAAFIGSLISVNTVAFLMAKVLDRPLSWFRVEYSCLLLYGPAAFAGEHFDFFPVLLLTIVL